MNKKTLLSILVSVLVLLSNGKENQSKVIPRDIADNIAQEVIQYVALNFIKKFLDTDDWNKRKKQKKEELLELIQ